MTIGETNQRYMDGKLDGSIFKVVLGTLSTTRPNPWRPSLRTEPDLCFPLRNLCAPALVGCEMGAFFFQGGMDVLKVGGWWPHHASRVSEIKVHVHKNVITLFFSVSILMVQILSNPSPSCDMIYD